MVILPRNSPADLLEQRLHGLGEGGIPSAGEIIAAVGTAATGRRAARLKGWAATALRRIGANGEALLMELAAQAASRGESAPSSTGTRPATPEEIAELFGP